MTPSELDRAAAETPRWAWWAMGIGISVGTFGVLVLVMGALMSETPTPKSGDYVAVTEYHVSPFLFWVGAATLAVGALLCWPSYHVTLGSYVPAPKWLAPFIAAVAAVAPAAALAVALPAASHSRLRREAFIVAGVVWLFAAALGISSAVASARNRLRQEQRVGDGGAVAAGEADDLAG